MASLPLIETYLEIEKVQDDNGVGERKFISYRYSDDSFRNDAILEKLQEFSFSTPNPAVRNAASQSTCAAVRYSYILLEDGRVIHYIFCLQCQQNNTMNKNKAITYCICSQHPYFRSFYKLLSIISDLRKQEKEQDTVHELLRAVANENRLPTSGSPIQIQSKGVVTIEHETPFCLPNMIQNDHISEFYRSFAKPPSSGQANKYTSNPFVRIFAHLLMERRFLVTSNDVRRFTNCCYALQAIIYPLKWELPFMYIPLLFPTLISLTGLTAPYIMGIHKIFLEEALKFSDNYEDDCIVLDNPAIVLDADNGFISAHPENDVKLLPKDVRILLESRLSNRAEMMSPQKPDYFCRIFMDALVLLIGDYSQFFVQDSKTNSFEFSWKKYVAYREPDYKLFAIDAYKNKLGMLNAFIHSRLDLLQHGGQIPSDDHFERRLKDRATIVKECQSIRLRNVGKQVMGKLRGTFTRSAHSNQNSHTTKTERSCSVAGNSVEDSKSLPGSLFAETASINSVSTLTSDSGNPSTSQVDGGTGNNSGSDEMRKVTRLLRSENQKQNERDRDSLFNDLEESTSNSSQPTQVNNRRRAQCYSAVVFSPHCSALASVGAARQSAVFPGQILTEYLELFHRNHSSFPQPHLSLQTQFAINSRRRVARSSRAHVRSKSAELI